MGRQIIARHGNPNLAGPGALKSLRKTPTLLQEPDFLAARTDDRYWLQVFAIANIGTVKNEEFIYVAPPDNTLTFDLNKNKYGYKNKEYQFNDVRKPNSACRHVS